MFSSALSLDAKLSSHPIEVECPDANMINQVCLSAFISKLLHISPLVARSSTPYLTRRLLQVLKHSLRICFTLNVCSVLRMLCHYVGEEIFLKGVSIYLKKRLYANSVTQDLWDGIAEASGKLFI